MALHICTTYAQLFWFVQCVLVVTFHDLCLPQLLSRPARELMFLLNLVEYMVVLLVVIFSPHGMYRYLFSISLRLVFPILVECSSQGGHLYVTGFGRFQER